MTSMLDSLKMIWWLALQLSNITTERSTREESRNHGLRAKETVENKDKESLFLMMVRCFMESGKKIICKEKVSKFIKIYQSTRENSSTVKSQAKACKLGMTVECIKENSRMGKWRGKVHSRQNQAKLHAPCSKMIY